ncbi:synaptic vesicle glycoprotein 2C-like [Drosophila eugracilis]|uniref:synaptic vesicle glycoprotein 2C-like n=1 Tax=Drosophila eugracilis TaxID=29029 RepID=UPI001BD9FFCC|nr:synaptic vesicle glycoprotein 2C-like [Drosophila eugracilis]
MEHFDIVMEEIGFGSVHLFATIALGLVQMLTIHETMGMGVIGPAAVCDLKMNQPQLASLMGAGFMGIICSSYFWGYITDKKGRRWILLRTIVVSSLCSVASMFTISFTSFFVMRFITCIFVAGPSFVAPTYLSEFCSNRILARTVTHMYMFTGFAMLSVPAWATLFLSSNLIEFEVELVGTLTLRPWRVLGCIYILPGVFAFCLLLILPESPKFLFMIGDTKRGLATMEWISRKNTGKSLTEEQVDHLLSYQENAQVRRSKGSHNFLRSMLNDAMPLVRKPFVGYFLCVCLVMFILGLLANGLGIWYTAMRNRCNMRQGNTKGMSFCRLLFVPETGLLLETEADFEAVCNDSFKGFNDSFILGIVYVVMYNFCWLSLFQVHRKVMFVFSLVASTTFGILLIFVTNTWIQLFSLVFLLSFPGVIVGLLGGSLLGFVPTFMRAKAMCIVLMWCRCGAAVGAVLVGFNMQFSCEMFLLAIAILPLSKHQ